MEKRRGGLRKRTSVLALTVSLLLFSAQAAFAVTTQLCFAIDGSGSVGDADFQLQIDGIADSVEDPSILPQTGDVELSLVQFPGGVEIMSTIINSQGAATGFANAVRAIVQSGGLTPMEQAIDDCTAEITGSPSFAPGVAGGAVRQVINIATDGSPTNPTATIIARDNAVAAGIDEIHAEAVGFGANTGFLLGLVWPQPGELLMSGQMPTDPENIGFVIDVNNFADFQTAIEAKILAITGTPGPGPRRCFERRADKPGSRLCRQETAIPSRGRGRTFREIPRSR